MHYDRTGRNFTLFLFLAASDTDSRSEDSDADAVLEEGNRGRFRYGRRMNRLVRDIDSSLDPANYDLMP